MKFNGILTLVVTVLAVVLISSACIIPVVQSTQSAQYSPDNNSNELFVIADGAESTPTNPTVLELTEDGYLVINGVTDTQAYASNIEKIWANNVGIRVNLMSSGYAFQSTLWTDATTSSAISPVKLFYDGSTLTGYDATDTVVMSVDSDFFIYPSSKGTYGQFDLRSADVRSSLHINKDATVFAGSNGNNYGFMKGTYADGFQMVGYSGNSTLDTRTLTYTSVLSDDGLTWQFVSKPAMVLSDSAGVAESSTSDWINIYAPIEYKYLSDNDSVIIAMLGIIPVLILLVPIMLVVRSFGVGRD